VSWAVVLPKFPVALAYCKENPASGSDTVPRLNLDEVVCVRRTQVVVVLAAPDGTC
jgi:hypothetical protein